MIKTYTYKIKTNKTLEQKFEEQLNITRYIYNLGKEVREESYKKGVAINYYDLSKQLTEAKKEFNWLKKAHVHTLQSVLERLEIGYKKFFSDLKIGNKTSIPKWAKKKDWKSIEFKQGNLKASKPCLRFEKDGKFNLPKLGKIKIFKSREIYGDIKLAKIIKHTDGWYLQVIFEEIEQIRENQSICAIDMGITYFLTTSDGEFIENPKHLFKYLKQLRIENRKLSRMKRGGNNYKKQVKVLQLLHQKVSRVRKDFLHKESRKLANNYGTVIREDLNISKMVKGSKLAKHILDCSWGTFFTFLEYKTNVIKVNPAYTSQKCSKCGHTCKENRKTQSLFECVKCNYTENADLQATFNILELGQQLMEANVSQ